MCPLYALEDYINLKCEEKSLYSYLFELVNRHGIRHNAYGINGLLIVKDNDYFVKRPVDYHTEALIDNSIHLSKYYAPFE